MDELQFPSFSKDDALDLGLRLVELGRQRSHPIAIDITKGEQVLFHAALEGATPDNERWIRAKQRTAVRYEVPSLLVGLRARAAGRRIEDNAWFDETEFAAHGGAFPIYVRGTGLRRHRHRLRPAAESGPRPGGRGPAESSAALVPGWTAGQGTLG